jgi:hypothetical protein
MRGVIDACLVIGAAVLWYIGIWTLVMDPFESYWVAFGTGYILLGVGLIGKTILGIAWVARKMRTG